MDDRSEFDAALNRFWRYHADLFALQGLARTNSITRSSLASARLAWLELRRMQDDLRCNREDDRKHLQKIADPFRRLLSSLSLAVEVPLMLLLEGDQSAWDRLADRLAITPPETVELPQSPSQSPPLTEAQQYILIALLEAKVPLRESILAQKAFGPDVSRCRDHARPLVLLGLIESGGRGRKSTGYRLTGAGIVVAEKLTRQFDDI